MASRTSSPLLPYIVTPNSRPTSLEELQVMKPDAGGCWRRFHGHDRWVPWTTSLRNLVTSSMLLLVLPFVPAAWVAHILHLKSGITFTLCFMALVPLEQVTEFAGEQMMFYLGKYRGDLLMITLQNSVEASLAITLLVQCELRLLQASVIGVVILRLLLVPGMAFLTGGARILEQNLSMLPTRLNHSLLSVSVLAILFPAVLFAASGGSTDGPGVKDVTDDPTRGHFLNMSRGISIIFIVMATQMADAPEELVREEHHLLTAMPKINIWVALATLAVTIPLISITVQMLVKGIDKFREEDTGVTEEWFGLVFLPFVSFAADAVVTTKYFIFYTLKQFKLGTPQPPEQLAKGRSIDSSIQFLLFWLPLMVLIAWAADKPLHLLFDMYEVALLVGTCFLVNTVTADAKTNWVEGLVLVGLYAVIGVVTWFYGGQSSAFMLLCHSVVAEEGTS